MTKTVSEAELATHLEDILERVYDHQEPVTVERDGEPLVQITPAPKKIGRSATEIRAAIGHLRFPDPDFADDLEEIQRSQPPTPDISWAN